MKKFLLRLSLAAAVTLAGVAIAPASHAQSDQDPATTNSQQQQPVATPQDSATPQQQNDAQMPEAQTQDAQAFNGRIVKESGQLVLKDPVAKISYKLDDQAKAKQYAGKQVKVTGKLNMNNNTIHVDSIELLS